MPPIYQYKCHKCGHEFEEFYKLHAHVEEDEPKLACDACGSTEKDRLPPTGTTFKNNSGGFYSNIPARPSRKSDD